MSKYSKDETAKFAKMLGANLKFCRFNEKQIKPMKTVAYFLGVSHQQIAKYEKGQNLPCSYNLVQLAKFYNVRTDDLVDPDFMHKRLSTCQ
tara:strand:+ start:431 stop:703 length:273 start_codon:yes stop_codon:yes gene_type:complete